MMHGFGMGSKDGYAGIYILCAYCSLNPFSTLWNVLHAWKDFLALAIHISKLCSLLSLSDFRRPAELLGKALWGIKYYSIAIEVLNHKDKTDKEKNASK